MRELGHVSAVRFPGLDEWPSLSCHLLQEESTATALKKEEPVHEEQEASAQIPSKYLTRLPHTPVHTGITVTLFSFSLKK
jgi:hypothetical protein